MRTTLSIRSNECRCPRPLSRNAERIHVVDQPWNVPSSITVSRPVLAQGEVGQLGLDVVELRGHPALVGGEERALLFDHARRSSA